MDKRLLLLAFCAAGLLAHGKPLAYYIAAAKENSPLINDCHNQREMQRAELGRLKAMYTHSRLELNGDWLFVPVVATDGGRTAFEWNAQDGTDYYGYDLGESSGHLHVGLTWTQPLLGNLSYKVVEAQARIADDMAGNRLRMEEHQLERAVTERYLLCLLDRTTVDFADSVGSLLARQMEAVRCLAENGLAKQSDVGLLAVEVAANDEARAAARQSLGTHLLDLNLLCGIEGEPDTLLDGGDVVARLLPIAERSLFAEQYRLDSLDAAARLHAFGLQYKPRLDLFAAAGLQAGDWSHWYRHFGVSAGLTFSWTIFDGRQKRWMERQTQLRQNTIRTYKDNAEYQRNMRVEQCLSEMDKFDERAKSLQNRLAEYERVLQAYSREMQAGQISVLDYITVLKGKIQAECDYLLLQTNRQLAVAAYNYWNW